MFVTCIVNLNLQISRRQVLFLFGYAAVLRTHMRVLDPLDVYLREHGDVGPGAAVGLDLPAGQRDSLGLIEYVLVNFR